MNPKSAPELATIPELPVFKSWGEEHAKEMSQKQADMYKRYCEDRAQKRKEELEEDIKVRDLFLEAGRKAFAEAGKSAGSLSPEVEDKSD